MIMTKSNFQISPLAHPSIAVRLRIHPSLIHDIGLQHAKFQVWQIFCVSLLRRHRDQSGDAHPRERGSSGRESELNVDGRRYRRRSVLMPYASNFFPHRVANRDVWRGLREW